MALLITAVLFAASPGLTGPLTVRIGVYENQPKIFTDKQNKVSGFWPELIESIAEKEQWQIEYVHGTWNEGLIRLRSNSIDILPDVAITKERAKIYTFSRDPILMSWSRLYVHGDNKNIQSIRDISGKRVAALENSVNLEGPDGLRELLAKFDISCTFVAFDRYSDVFQAIADQQVDVGMVNREFAQENAEKYKLKKTSILF